MRWIVATAWGVIKDAATFIRPFIESFVRKEIPEWILGLGGIVFIFFVGFVVTLVIGQYYRKVPWLGIFVDGVRRLVSILFSKDGEVERRNKGRIVLVEYPHKRSWSPGLVVEAHLEDDIRMLRILVSKPPTFWTGDLVFFPEEDVVRTNISKPEWLTMITTGGTFGGKAELGEALREVRRRMKKEWGEVVERLKEALRKGEIRLPKGGELGF